MKAFRSWLAMVLLALLMLEVFFAGRIGLMRWVDPQSTSFQRSEAWRIVSTKGSLPWSQQWVPYNAQSDNLKRAVIASEDSEFIYHDGVDWDALRHAWKKNAQEEQRVERAPASNATKPQGKNARKPRAPKIIGGSTISQQLAKNLFLSGERSLVRKGQEFVLTMALETFLDKERILEIYLNSVEWGEGVFGAQAAAQHYFGKPAAQLGAYEAARLAVMLPRPKYFEHLPRSPYLSSRSATIVARMPDSDLP